MSNLRILCIHKGHNRECEELDVECSNGERVALVLMRIGILGCVSLVKIFIEE